MPLAQPLLDLDKHMPPAPPGITQEDFSATLTFLMKRAHALHPWYGSAIQATLLGNLADELKSLVAAGWTIQAPTDS